MRYRNQNNIPIVLALIAINVIVYFATSGFSRNIFGLSSSIITNFGVNSITLSKSPWTIFTALFIHDGIFHILFNMLTLYYYGTYVVQLVGEIKFLIVYLIGGLIGNLLFILLAPGSFAVGASGAIFALGGVLAVMRPKLKVVLFPIPLPMDLWIAIILGFLLISFMGGIAWQAHLGGLVTGLAAGYILRMRERRRFW